ncbi:hypothetical protein VNO78_32957 [Psophocarpus tetragonolobus]|uniref:Uncharacterized protein n=1 Tax=Psophocarpus tetragonolobus TaxID=3891 RepID=A0AAN9NWG6_PSOTE
MGSYFFKVLFAVLVCFLHNQVNQLFILGFNHHSQRSQVKCIEIERQALLNFKQSVQDYYGILSTWKDDENNGDCCKWRGIECNNETGHIQQLDLHGSEFHYLRGPINITSLVPLKNLEYLDLSLNNVFTGGPIPEHIGSFKNLRYLNLSHSSFFGRIPCELGNLSKLEYLDLKTTDLDSEIPSQLGKLTSLRYLDLSDNNRIYGEIPFGNLSHLRYLDLTGGSFSGPLPFHVGNLPMLETLKLGGNFDVKSEDAEWLSSLSSLTALSLRSMPNLGSSPIWLQVIRKLIPYLRELRLVGCNLSDDNVSSLFPSHSTNLSILDLSGNILTSSTFQFLLNYPKFPSLVILDLSSNNLTSSSIFQGNFSFNSKLRELYLSKCSLTDESFVLPSVFIQNSSSLITLDLSDNLLKSSWVYHWLFNFTTNLRGLNLGGNLLEGTIPDGFGKTMNSLEFLVLSSNKLQGNIPASLGNICTLQELYLSNNNLSGGLSSFVQNSSWCKRHVLHSLDLSNNWITGILPNLSIFTSLRKLDLSSNRLTGEIPKSIGLLHQLQGLRLDENYLEGDVNELHLNSLSQLMELDLTYNSLSLKFGTTWIPPFQLLNLGLASCKLGPSFPSWIQTQSQLSFLDISDAEIDDFVPEWFWSKLQSISEMNMSCNNLKGTIPNLPIKLANDGGGIFILHSNQFEGGIPSFLSRAQTLDLSKNKISNLNTLVCGNRASESMRTLDLSNNQIMGQLPNCWEHLSSLAYLDLRNNKLSGKIPQSMGTLVNLQALVLRNNNLIGELPLTLKNCSSLVLLDVSENLLSGPVPSWIGESLQQLKLLSLRGNNFFGSVPAQLCYLSQIQVLDLSRNNLSSEIPTCVTNFTTMMERSIMSREIVRKRKISSQESYEDIYDSYLLLTWKGQDFEFWNPENLLKSIDLSSNDLTGEIPKEIGGLLGLISLNLSRNNLYGKIPSEIGNLGWLEFLDLSRNHFSGKIPFSLSNIDRLAVLDLSNNNLSGRIPWERHFQTFEASSFEGNLGLCGKQLQKNCPGDENETIPQPQGPAVHGEDDNSVFYNALYMSLGLGFFAGFWGLFGPILLWKSLRIAYLGFLNRLTDYVLVTFEVNVAKCHRWFQG